MITAAIAVTMTSCGNDDDFTESIFDENVPVVDNSATTAPFDQWVYDNFTVPYNVDIQYKFNFPASDLNFQLSPAEYKRSQVLSHFIMYLFYDIYNKYGGEDFMKRYGPRIFHFIGSSGYSPTTGTEVLGTASGGVKITLYKINEMKPYTPDVIYTDRDIDDLNEDYFHTMHHEFSHILHQTKSYPVTFGQVTSGTYDPINWQDRDSTLTHTLGYVTHYASGASYEDFVETLSCIITDTDHRWMTRIIDGCLKGVRPGDKEAIMEFITEKIKVGDIDKPNTVWNNFTLYEESEYDATDDTYKPTDRYVMDVHRNLKEKVVNKASTKMVNKFQYKEYKSFTSFRDFLNNWVEIVNNDDVVGMNAILKKIDIANTWYKEKWGLDAFVIREELCNRQNRLNDYLHNEVTIYDYQ